MKLQRYPRNIQYIPVVEIFAFLELEQKLPFFKGLFLFCLMVRSAFNLIGNLKYQYTLLYLLLKEHYLVVCDR